MELSSDCWGTKTIAIEGIIEWTKPIRRMSPLFEIRNDLNVVGRKEIPLSKFDRKTLV